MNIFRLFFYFVFHFLFCVSVFSSNIKQELLSFIENNNLAEVKRILDSDQKLDFTFFGKNDLFTPLSLAAFHGHKEMTEYLIQKGFGINTKNVASFTPLHLAALEGHKEVCELLINNKAHIDDSVFWSVVTDNYLELAKYLVGKIIELKYQGGAIPQSDESISRALHIASTGGFNEIIELLLDQKWQFDVINERKYLDYSPLHGAVLEVKPATVDLLIKKGANVNVERREGDKYETALHTACMRGNSEIVKLLLDNGAFTNITNFDGKYPVHIAIEEGHKDIVELFIKRQDETVSYVLLDGHKSLFLAASHGRMPLVKYLIEQGQSISYESLELINNKEIKNYILFHKNAVKISDLNKNVFYSLINNKFLNIGGKDRKLEIQIKFEAINTKENLYKVSFMFSDGKKNNTKTLFLKIITDLNNSEKIVSFKFYQYNKQKGYIEKSSVAYNEDITHKKNNKTGKLIRDEKILLFEKEFLVSYNEDFSELSFTMKSGKFSETIKLSNAPLEFINQTSQVGKKVVENLLPVIIAESKIRPSLEEFCGTTEKGIFYKVLRSSENILFAKIYENLIRFYYGNTKIKDYDSIITIVDGKVKYLKYLDNIYEVNLNKEGQLVLVFNSESKKRAFEMVLEKTNEPEAVVLNSCSTIYVPRVKEQEIKEEPIKRKDSIVEPIEVKISKNQQKKNRNKNRRAKNIQKKPSDLLLDVPEAEQASYFPPITPEDKKGNFIITEPKKIEQIIQEEKYVLPYEKDDSEFLGMLKPAIKLKPTDHKECPLLNGPWEGFGFSTMNDKLPNKRIILSLTNTQGRKGVWGSLWASALGQNDNYVNGKNIHWSYHKQDDNKEYLYISHHYLFELKKSLLDDSYDLILVKNNTQKLLHDVCTYKISKIEQGDINNYAREFIDIKHDEIHEEEMLEKYNKIYENILSKLYSEKIINTEKNIDFDLYFISDNVWEIIFYTDNQIKTFKMTLRK